MEEDSDTPRGPHTYIKLCHQVLGLTLWLAPEDSQKDHEKEFLAYFKLYIEFSPKNSSVNC